jgi:hypothetical protein
VLPLHPAKAEAGAKIEYGKQLNSLKTKRETARLLLDVLDGDSPLSIVTMKRRNPGESSNRSCRSGVVKGCRWSISQPVSGGPNGDLYGAAHR